MVFLSTVLILASAATLLYYWFIRDDRIYEREFAKRNLKYVKIQSLYDSYFNKKERSELVKDAVIKREGRVFGFNMLNKKTIMVADADLIQTILIKEFTQAPNRREFPVTNKILHENVAMVRDEQWKRLRAISTPAFSVGKLKRMKLCIDETVQTLIRNLDAKIQENTIQNMKNIFDCFTIDTIMQTAFGVKVDSLNEPNNPIIVHGRKIFQSDVGLVDLAKFGTIFFAPKLAQLLNIQVQVDATEFFTKFSSDIMNQKRQEFAKTKDFAKANSFIEFMLEAEEENKRLMSEENLKDEEVDLKKPPTKYMNNEEIVSQCIMFFLAGFDTVSTCLTLAAYQLALNPDKQEKLFRETTSILRKIQEETPEESDPFKLVSYDNLPKFEYAGAVINESLRIESPAMFLERRVSQDMELSNPDGSIRFNVKKHDMLHVPIYSVHRDPKYFRDPEQFKPERFVGVPEFHKYAYLPFGSGPRKCIAKSMALMEAKLALVHVIRNFKFEICEQTKIPLDWNNQFFDFLINDLITPKDATLRIVRTIQ